jgi:hypothetical protein
MIELILYQLNLIYVECKRLDKNILQIITYLYNDSAIIYLIIGNLYRKLNKNSIFNQLFISLKCLKAKIE